MKRITYISRFARDLSAREIQQLGEVAAQNNRRDGITGVLVCSAGVFFQIIEGEDEKIDGLFERIRRDERHQHVLCLKTEFDVPRRAFPDWSMKIFNLDESHDTLMQPLRSLFQVMMESQGILEKYTQPTVLRFMHDGINPLGVEPRREEKTILFCDMVASSLFASALPVEDMMAMVNEFFDICSGVIARRGGEVTKFIGDCVMAYFPRDHVDEAIRASLDVLSALDACRKSAPADSGLQVLYCGIGLAFGEVMEGNIGSNVKMEYTILGDAVNKAAFLESLTRKLPRALVFSSGVRNMASSNWPFIHLGSYALKENQQPIPVFSIDDPTTFKPFNPAQLNSRIITILEHITITRFRTRKNLG